MTKLLRPNDRQNPLPLPAEQIAGPVTYPNIVMMSVAVLNPGNRRLRRRNAKALRKLRASIQWFRIVRPILIDQGNNIIDGYGIVDAAKKLGFHEVPTLMIEHLSAAEIKALRIALNRLQEEGEWDREVLRDELIQIVELDEDFDLGVVGFEPAELDVILEDGRPTDPHQPDPADDISSHADGQAVSVRGDLFVLGDHRLLCGDACELDDVLKALGGLTADLVFTDHPYNLPSRTISGLGSTKHADFVMAAGEMSPQQFDEFLSVTLQHLKAATKEGAVIFCYIDWRSVQDMLRTSRELGLTLLNIYVWTKQNGGMGSFYRSKNELVVVFRNGDKAHMNNIELGRHGRYRTNHWEYPGFNTFSPERESMLAAHPTIKPFALVADAIQDASRRGEVVLDVFAGSGTTMIAAEGTGRRACCVELDPSYVDTAIRRFEDQIGIAAIHEPTGFTFDQLAEQRRQQDQRPRPQTEEPQCQRSSRWRPVMTASCEPRKPVSGRIRRRPQHQHAPSAAGAPPASDASTADEEGDLVTVTTIPEAQQGRIRTGRRRLKESSNSANADEVSRPLKVSERKALSGLRGKPRPGRQYRPKLYAKNGADLNNLPYETGYGAPPESSKFAPGVCGNPKGRPRKQKRANLEALPWRRIC